MIADRITREQARALAERLRTLADALEEASRSDLPISGIVTERAFHRAVRAPGEVFARPELLGTSVAATVWLPGDTYLKIDVQRGPQEGDA